MKNEVCSNSYCSWILSNGQWSPGSLFAQKEEMRSLLTSSYVVAALIAWLPRDFFFAFDHPWFNTHSLSVSVEE